MRYPLWGWFWPFRRAHISAIEASLEVNREREERLARDLLNETLIASGDAPMASVWRLRNRDFVTFSKMVCSIQKQKSSFKLLRRALKWKFLASACSQLSNDPRSGFSDKVSKCHFSRGSEDKWAILTKNFYEKSHYFWIFWPWGEKMICLNFSNLTC